MTRVRLSIAVAVVLIAATSAHAFYRIGTRPTGALLVSTLEIGQPVPKLAIQPLIPQLPIVSGCRIIVVFSPACPHCHSAKQAEARSTQLHRLPTTWLAAENDSATIAFGRGMHADSRLGFAASAKKKLRIQAVPAAFLVDPEDVVRNIWVYQGTEDHDDLRKNCT